LMPSDSLLAAICFCLSARSYAPMALKVSSMCRGQKIRGRARHIFLTLHAPLGPLLWRAEQLDVVRFTFYVFPTTHFQRFSISAFQHFLKWSRCPSPRLERVGCAPASSCNSNLSCRKCSGHIPCDTAPSDAPSSPGWHQAQIDTGRGSSV
jgi:hypothetical protein